MARRALAALLPAAAASALRPPGAVPLQGAGRVCSVADYGAAGDGRSDDTRAVAAAVAACAGGAPGAPGTVVLPAGSGGAAVYLCGSFEIVSHLTIRVEPGATLLGSSSPAAYPLVPPLPSYGVGRDDPVKNVTMRYRPFIFGTGVTGVTLSGGGTIDGGGPAWWSRFFLRTLEYTRPRLIEFMHSRDIVVEDLHLKNSAFWTLHPYDCDGVVARRLRITAPAYSANTDGIDPDSSRNVDISDIYYSGGDDAIAIKSGLNEAGRAFGVASENISVRNLTVESEVDNLSTNGVSIGSEMSGGVRNVTVDGATIRRCEAGLYVKSAQGRGGAVRDVTYRNVVTERTLQPIKFVMHYSYIAAGRGTPDPEIPAFHNLTVVNLTATGAAEAGVFTGLSASPIQGVSLRNVHVESLLGWNCSYVNGSAHDVSPAPCGSFIVH